MGLSKTDKRFLDDNARAQMLDEWRNDAAYVASGSKPAFAIGSDGITYTTNTSNGVDGDGNNIGPGAVDPVGDNSGVWSPYATGGATGGGRDQVFFENDQVVTEDYTITTGKNAVSAGVVSIGVLLTISNISSDGSAITVVTSSDHNLVASNSVNITNTTNYNGSYAVASVTNSTTFTITSALNVAAETSGNAEKPVTVTVPNDSSWVVV